MSTLFSCACWCIFVCCFQITNACFQKILIWLIILPLNVPTLLHIFYLIVKNPTFSQQKTSSNCAGYSLKNYLNLFLNPVGFDNSVSFVYTLVTTQNTITQHLLSIMGRWRLVVSTQETFGVGVGPRSYWSQFI